MRTAALKQAQLDPADLGAGMLLHNIGQQGSQAAELGVAEAVRRRGLGLRDEASVRIVNALGNRDKNLAVLLIDGVNIRKELVHVKIALRQIDQIRAGAVGGRQSSAGSEPAGVTAHNLDDHDHAVVINAGILVDLHAGGGNILRRTAEAGAVVRSEKIIVDGFGDTHHTALIAHRCHIAADLVAGIHGIVSAVIEEIADVILFEDLQDAFVVLVILFRICHLVAAGAEFGRGGMQKKAQFFGILFIHDIKLVIQDTLNAVGRPINLRNLRGIQRSTDHAVGTGVDDGSGTAGLTENAGTDQLFRHFFSP